MKGLDLEQLARDLVDDATRYHGAPWKRVMNGDGGFYGVTDRTGSVVAASPPVSALIAAAPTLITALLARLEAAEAQVARVWEFARGHDDKYVMMGIQEALDGDTRG